VTPPSLAALPQVTPAPTPVATPTPLPISSTLPLSVTQVVDARGGRVATGDGRIQVDVPPGVFRTPARVRIQPRAIQAQPEAGGALLQFDLGAQDLSTAVPVHEFNQPLTLTVNVRGLLDPGRIPEGYHVYLAYHTEDGQRNEITPITVNYDLGTISAQITHFSSWDAGVAPGTPGVWALAYNPPQASLFSGAATYAIALNLPAGRNGAQPQLSLTYNSARLNGRTGANAVERGPLGDSWSIDAISIIRNRWFPCEWRDASGGRTSSDCFRDMFTLLIDGTGYDLDPSPVSSATNPETLTVRYYAQDGPGLYIERHNGCLRYDHDSGACTSLNPAGGDSPLNTSGEYWLVRLPDGRQARLGYTADAEQVVTNVCNPYAMQYCHHPGENDQIQLGYRGKDNPTPPNGSTTARSWRVDTITDTLGNTLTFQYLKYPATGTTKRLTLRHIYYNGGLTHIALPGNDTPTDDEPTIDRIEITNTNASGVPALVRRYLLGRTKDTKHYNHCHGGDPADASYTTLTRVQEQDRNGLLLPAQTFTYVWQPTAPDCEDLKQLAVIDNGYGGATAITYASIGLWNNYAVQSLRSTDGLTGTAALYSTYAYGNACYDYAGSPCASRATTACGSACDNRTWRNYLLAGFDAVTVTQLSATSQPLAQTSHFFYNTNPYWQLGREWRTVQVDATLPTHVQQQDSTFSTVAYGASTFTYLSEQGTTLQDAGGTLYTRTSYTHDGYNNPSAQYEYGAELRVPEAGFEGDIFSTNCAPGGWSVYGGAQLPTVTTGTVSFAGEAGVQLSGTNTGGVCQDVTGLISGTVYTARMWVSAAAGATGQAQLWLHDTTGANSRASTAVTPPVGSWQILTVAYTANATGKVRIHVNYPVVGNGGALYADEVALARSADVGDERSTHHWVNTNTSTAWLVDKVAWENIYQGITLNGGPGLQTQTLNYYDGASDYHQPPTKGLLTRADRGGAGGPWVSSLTGYDAWGNARIVTDTRGYTATTDYDGQYHLYPTRVTNAQGQATLVSFDVVQGVPISVTDPNGATTQFTYDGFGRLKKVIKPGDSLTYPSDQYNYFDGGDGETPLTAWPLQMVHLQRQAAKDGCSGGWGTWERTYYDGLGRVVQRQTPLQDWTCTSGQMAVVNTFYDATGQVAEQSVPYAVPDTATNGLSHYQPPDRNQPSTETAYDGLGRTSIITGTDGSLAVHHYGLSTSSGPTLTYDDVMDANRHRDQYRTDALGRLVRVYEFSGDCGAWGYNCAAPYSTPWAVYTVTQYAYDVLGHLRVVTDALQNTTVITYNAVGLKTAMIDPDMGKWAYQYDAAGNLITQTDALNNALWFKYDALNRLSEKRQTNGSGSLLASYAYDQGTNGVGHRVAMTNTWSAATWAYDNRGRMTSESKTITGAGAYATGYGYDGLDRVITTTYPTLEVITQTYNLQGLVENVRSQTQNQWYAKNLDYNANGALALLQWGNNLNTTYTYDPLSFRLKQVQTGVGASVQNLQYRYDRVGNVLTITDTASFSPTAQYQRFTYDALDRLLTAQATGGSSGTYSETYAYNAIGNITTTSRLGNYAYGLKPHAVITAGSNLYTYDANGNMLTRVEVSGTQRITYTQSWDRENRLAVVTNTVSGQVSQYFYDGDGNRVKKVQNGQTTVYVGAIYEKNLTTGVTTTYYFAGGQRVALRQGGALSYLVADHLGSTSLTLDANGSKVGELKYTPYGETRSTWGGTPTDRRFTGQRQEDSSLGSLYDFNARFYSPALGRFLSADTIVPDPSNPQKLNRYTYGLSNPIKYRDPSGHDVDCAIGESGCRQQVAKEKGTYTLPSGQYLYTQQYGWFDRNHIGAASPKDVIDQVRYSILHGGSEVNVRDGTKGGFRFRSTYQVVGKDGATEEYINGVALGIYTDFEVRFEFWEGLIAPFTPYTTMYAIEDLPSDYLGFAMAAKDLTLEQAFAHLEPDSSKVTGTNTDPPRSWDNSQKNYWISPKVNGVNVSWPQELAITPIGLGDGVTAWGFVGSWGSGLFGIRAEEQ
jgi:RHS repeat-associated protein